LQALFQSAQHLYEKREGPGSETPKNIRIRIPNTANKQKEQSISDRAESYIGRVETGMQQVPKVLVLNRIGYLLT
jgi:hypothetical protein